MGEEAKVPEHHVVPLRSSAENEKHAEARGKDHKATISSDASPVEKKQTEPVVLYIERLVDQPGHLVVSPDSAAPYRGPSQISEDRGAAAAPTSGQKLPRRHRKHKHTSHKTGRGSDEKADAAGHAGSARVKRRKSKMTVGGFPPSEDLKRSQVPPVRPSQVDDVPKLKPEGSTPEMSELKPVEIIFSEEAEKQMRNIADDTRHAEHRHSVASATAETEREAEQSTHEAVGEGRIIGGSEATAKIEADSALPAATEVAGNGEVYDGSAVPTDIDVDQNAKVNADSADDAKVNAESAVPTGAEAGSPTDANAHSALPTNAKAAWTANANAGEGIDASVKTEEGANGVDGKTGTVLRQQTRRRSSVAVRLMAPEDEQHGTRTAHITPTTVPWKRGSKAARPGRMPCRKSDGDLRSLYSLVALKELATTLRTDSPDRAQQGMTHSSLFQNESSRVTWLLWFAIALGVGLTLILLIGGGRKTEEQSVCASSSCAQLSAAFEGVLNYSVDPCVDLDAFVCSKALRQHSGGQRGPRSLVAQLISEYELAMVQLFLDGKTTFMASRVVSEFLHECTSSQEAPPSIDRFHEFFGFVSLPWPFDPSDEFERHPLEAVLALSFMWGIDTWFRAYIHTADFSDAPVLFIEATAQASSWLDFVHTLEELGSREKYFRQFHGRYNASLPAPEIIARRLATEKEVLSVLDAVRSPATSTRPVIASMAKVAAQVRNSTVENWLESVTTAPGGGAANERTLVSVQDVRVLQAVDQLLYNYSEVALIEHLSWWLVQMLTVVGWPQGYVIIAGSQEAAAKQLKAECYRTMAARFGLLLASESAVQFFTHDSRREVNVFLRGLLDFLGAVAAKAPWLSDKAKAAITRRIHDLDVTLWPLRVETTNETLWQLYSDFCVSCKQADTTTSVPESISVTAASTRRSKLMDYWLDNSIKFWRLTAAQFEDMQLLWQGDRLEALRYEPWTNRLRVSHVALQSPFFHPASIELQHANFGGLGASFLANALQMFAPPVPDIDPDVSMETWPDMGGITDLASSLNCSAEFLLNLRDVAALGLAWHALKGKMNASSGDSSKGPSRIPLLAIKDEKNVVHLYSGEQLFFLTYCRSRCARSRRLGSARGPDCNEAVRSIGDFGRTFNCAPGSPMTPVNACYVSEFF